MRMQIYGTPERKEKSNLNYYFLAVLGGILLFLLLLFFFKTLYFLLATLIGWAISYWMFALGGMAAILIIRKTLFRRRIKSNVMREQEM